MDAISEITKGIDFFWELAGGDPINWAKLSAGLILTIIVTSSLSKYLKRNVKKTGYTYSEGRGTMVHYQYTDD
ncbi:MAG: hypothetical protein FWC79_01370 [Oscillospiraceae bacterium]|nr:hypothetical protein [Oscillospiraceae bacterium]